MGDINRLIPVDHGKGDRFPDVMGHAPQYRLHDLRNAARFQESAAKAQDTRRQLIPPTIMRDKPQLFQRPHQTADHGPVQLHLVGDFGDRQFPVAAFKCHDN